jgi:hypothetical protein
VVEILSTVSACSDGISGGSWTCVPVDITHENGIRNFTDAASQSQYLARGEFLRKAHAASATITVNAVDCQR